MALSIPGTINLESTLSYLGLGLGIDTPSLGLILSKVRGFFLDYPYLLVFPASIVSIISISFYIMGNALSDAADPRRLKVISTSLAEMIGCLSIFVIFSPIC